MLVKSHCLDYAEDFGLLVDGQVHLYDSGPVSKTSKDLQLSPVVRLNALWMDRDLKVKCEIADTIDKKVLGLQGHTKLKNNCGMYFPYEPFSKVSFHQGMVPFSLDLIFICESQIIQTEKRTIVGSSDKWVCEECDGVIEVVGGWCDKNEIEVGDRVCLAAVSEQDLVELENQKAEDFANADRIGWLVALSELV